MEIAVRFPGLAVCVVSESFSGSIVLRRVCTQEGHLGTGFGSSWAIPGNLDLP